MKLRKVLSLFTAAAISVSSFAGLAINAGAADTVELSFAGYNGNFYNSSESALISGVTPIGLTSGGRVQKGAPSSTETYTLNNTSDATAAVLGGYFDADNDGTIDSEYTSVYFNYIGNANDHVKVSVESLPAGTYTVCYAGTDNNMAEIDAGDSATVSAISTVDLHTSSDSKGKFTVWYADITYTADYTGDIIFKNTGGWLPDTMAIKIVTQNQWVPETNTITYAKGDGVEGTPPESVTKTEGSVITLPVNRTLYVEGKTLTGWSDGTTTYAPGASYTISSDVTLTAVFSDNTAALGDAETSVDFNFRRDQGAPVLNSEGNSTILVGQATINGTSIDVKMDIDTSKGKCNNVSNTQWTQINSGTVMTVPVVKGSVVTVGDVYHDTTADAYSINGVSKTGDDGSETITEVPELGTIDIVDSGAGYYRGITVTYPAVSDLPDYGTVKENEDGSTTVYFGKSSITTGGGNMVDDTTNGVLRPDSLKSSNNNVVLTMPEIDLNGSGYDKVEILAASKNDLSISLKVGDTEVATFTELNNASWDTYASCVSDLTTTAASGNVTLDITHVSGNGYCGNYLYVRFYKAPEASAVSAYTATWDFQRQNNGNVIIELEGDEPYSYADTTGTYTLVVDTSTNGGKLNNAGWDDWAQCNGGTTFIIPAYKGMKLTYNCMNSDSAITVEGTKYVAKEYTYIGDESSLTVITDNFGYLKTISVAPVTVYDAAGTVTGVDAGALTGSTITFTASNGQVYTGTISEDNSYAVELPAGSYTAALLSDDYYIPSGSVTINSAEIPALTVAESLKLKVSGSVANPPTEAYKLVFTSLTGAETSIDVAAGAESYNVQLVSGTYTITSPNGELSALSSESFDVSASAVEKNIYFPEVYTAPADLSNITVGEGQQYETIRDALESIKIARSNGNSNRATIVLKAGETFREPVDITSNDVTITSDASNPAKITWYYGSGYSYYSLNSSRRYDIDRVMTKVKTYAQVDGADATDNRWGSTLRVGGTGFICENVVVENSFNQYVTDEELADGVKGSYTREKDKTVNIYEATSQAAAITIDRDNCVLYNCDFIGSQDTFFTNTQNTYVKKCIIRGQTDYIYGGGTVLFDECQLVWSGYDDEERGGYITAGSGIAGEMYIFRDCTIKYSDDTSRKYAPGNYGRTWQNAPTVYFLNCTDEDDCVSGWSGMGSGVYEVSTLGVYNFTDSSYNTAENAQNTSLAFDTAADIYENVLTTIFDGNAPKYFTNAVTTMEEEGLKGVEDTEKGDHVYGVVTEITAGSDATVSGVKWIIKDASDNVYIRSTSDEVNGTEMLSKGTFPTISGEGKAEIMMLFHAEQGTYNVVSIAE